MEKLDFAPYLNALSDKAFDPGLSRGRRHSRFEDDDIEMYSVLNSFALDEDKIIKSKALRRLYDKTQVFIKPEQQHVRNRGFHTHEVAALAVKIARILGLNVDLCRAIALYHDAGHAPFGHLGEELISEISGRTFRHEIMSVVMAQKIERGGKGLNLSWEVLEGVLHHSTGKNGVKMQADLPLEYAVVMFADKIAYTFADLNDALRIGYFYRRDLPVEYFSLGGPIQRLQEDVCVQALVQESCEKGIISFHDSMIAGQFEALRQWSYINFYEKLNAESDRVLARQTLKKVMMFLENCFGFFDYDPFFVIALLTDGEAIKLAQIAESSLLKGWKEVAGLSFMEILKRLPTGTEINIFDPDLKAGDFCVEN